VFILKIVKVVYFGTSLQVLIPKLVTCGCFVLLGMQNLVGEWTEKEKRVPFGSAQGKQAPAFQECAQPYLASTVAQEVREVNRILLE
jgi:hypothetical protein